MSGECFFDTNILIYSVALEDPRRAVAETLLANGGVVSVQVLNEFIAVASRKLGMSWSEIREALSAFRVFCRTCVSITLGTHDLAATLAETHGIHIYDALIVAAALEAGCTTLYSEDLQNGWLVDGRLEVSNPFSHLSI